MHRRSQHHPPELDLRPIANHRHKPRAAIELVLASLVDPTLSDAVLKSTRLWLNDHVTDAQDPIRAAQATAILVWAFGLVVVSTRHWTAGMDRPFLSIDLMIPGPLGTRASLLPETPHSIRGGAGSGTL